MMTEQERAEGLVEHLVQRLVEVARLAGVVGDRGVQDQAADDGDGDALADVADLAEHQVRLAGLAGLALGGEVLGVASR